MTLQQQTSFGSTLILTIIRGKNVHYLPTFCQTFISLLKLSFSFLGFVFCSIVFWIKNTSSLLFTPSIRTYATTTLLLHFKKLPFTFLFIGFFMHTTATPYFAITSKSLLAHILGKQMIYLYTLKGLFKLI